MRDFERIDQVQKDIKEIKIMLKTLAFILKTHTTDQYETNKELLALIEMIVKKYGKILVA